MAPYEEDTSAMLYDHLDEATQQAILRIQIADLEEAMTSKLGGAAAEGDAALAANLLKQNLEEVHTGITDRRMVLSMADAVIQDSAILAQHLREETMARDDRLLASKLQPGSKPHIADTPNAGDQVDNEMLAKLAGMHMSEKAAYGLMPEEQETTPGSLFSRPKRHTCEACAEEVSYFKLFTTPCGHEYCGDCIRQLFNQSLTDETLFPPRCCRQTIPIDSKFISLFLNKDFREQYEEKRVETETTNRTYCYNTSCSAFVPPKNIAKGVAECAKCRARTCIGCKKEAHTGVCKKDMELSSILAVVRSEGWQICSKCGHAVELNYGCHHMT
jgi:hypothetical protein